VSSRWCVAVQLQHLSGARHFSRRRSLSSERRQSPHRSRRLSRDQRDPYVAPRPRLLARRSYASVTRAGGDRCRDESTHRAGYACEEQGGPEAAAGAPQHTSPRRESPRRRSRGKLSAKIPTAPERTSQMATGQHSREHNAPRSHEYGIFTEQCRRLYKIIKISHHHSIVTNKEAPYNIHRMAQTLSSFIKPASPNPVTQKALLDNAQDWLHATMVTLRLHYECSVLQEILLLFNMQAGDWRAPFEVACGWINKSVGRRLAPDAIRIAEGHIVKNFALLGEDLEDSGVVTVRRPPLHLHTLNPSEQHHHLSVV